MTLVVHHPTQTPAARKLSAKLNRYMLVTLVASPTNLAVYALLLGATSWHPGVANMTAAAIITMPTYFANRRWVWGVRTQHSLQREVLPYWITTAVNVSTSTAVAGLLNRLGASDAVLVGATLGVYTALWLVRFIVLDWIFSHRSQLGR